MFLSCEDEWKNYVEVVKSSSVRCLKVAIEKGCSPIVVAVDDNVDVEPVENLTQDEELHAVVVIEVDRSCEPGALHDDFDEEMFDEDDSNGDGTHDMVDIAQGSEDDKVDVASTDEDDFTSGPSTSDDVLEDEYRSEPSSDDESDCCERGFADAIGVSANGSLRIEYNDVELRQLKVVLTIVSFFRLGHMVTVVPPYATFGRELSQFGVSRNGATFNNPMIWMF
jgi:hypothetical protein